MIRIHSLLFLSVTELLCSTLPFESKYESRLAKTRAVVAREGRVHFRARLRHWREIVLQPYCTTTNPTCCSGNATASVFR
jgi:hypothetical protein